MNMGGGNDRRPMQVVVSDLDDLTEKIHSLDLEGYSNSEIASFLNTRPRHVADVLAKGETPAGGRTTEARQKSLESDAESRDLPDRVRVAVGSLGQVAIPERFLRSLSIGAGDTVIIMREKDGLVIVSQAAEVERVRQMISRYVPASVALVEDLIAERERRSSARTRDV